MEDLVNLAVKWLKPGGHGLIFCSNMQFHLWHEILHAAQIEVEVSDDEEVEKQIPSIKKREQVFYVENHPLVFVRRPGYYTSNPIRNNVNHVNVVDMAIHFWKKGLSPNEASKKVNYNHPSTSTGTLRWVSY